MTTTTPPAALNPGCAGVHQHRAAGLAGFLAGYSGPTREAYELDLRQYASWCHQHHPRLFQARRAEHPGTASTFGGTSATEYGTKLLKLAYPSVGGPVFIYEDFRYILSTDPVARRSSWQDRSARSPGGR